MSAECSIHGSDLKYNGPELECRECILEARIVELEKTASADRDLLAEIKQLARQSNSMSGKSASEILNEIREALSRLPKVKVV